MESVFLEFLQIVLAGSHQVEVAVRGVSPLSDHLEKEVTTTLSHVDGDILWIRAMSYLNDEVFVDFSSLYSIA